MSKRITIRKKPVAPQRNRFKPKLTAKPMVNTWYHITKDYKGDVNEHCCSEEYLQHALKAQDLIDRLAVVVKEDPNAIVDIDVDYSGCCYEGDTPNAFLQIFARESGQGRYEAALEKYNKAKKKYDEWYKENKEEIEAELKRRRQDEREKDLKAQAKRIEQLEKELSKLKKD